jgi:hypothetical protein
MTALVLENLAALPTQIRSLRMLLAKVTRAIDALVSARAARQVPEWQLRRIRREVARYQKLARTEEARQFRRQNG